MDNVFKGVSFYFLNVVPVSLMNNQNNYETNLFSTNKKINKIYVDQFLIGTNFTIDVQKFNHLETWNK